MANEILMTAEGYKALKDELEDLKTIKRGEVSEKIRVARGFGDLSENSEYDEAKNEQAIVEARIQTLEEQLKNAKILDKGQLSTQIVSVGTKVRILDMEFDEEMEYRIVGSVESNQSMDTITDESPVGRGLLGHKVGEVVDIKVPAGVLQFKILEITL
ncbi:transcription elongation factor GreA [Merdimmobilis hominis]|jgi:transcription elongation factor GreA|uniref:Transcription elongation factor GreA n=1 Tax=uncultured Anaerotruncus sp. TaxID=905011 RepID=A0A6N2T5X9_9FIRM|nr:transcription elongation factor GreA [Merdimmobilis hominis]MCD4835908.1 transcription elongation factor GreA [Merdimmobilis hominis]PWL60771.1 MAG: transcription elongation factor GreA [Oscillospiraceae bacterium]